jgi:beta-lactamase class A
MRHLTLSVIVIIASEAAGEVPPAEPPWRTSLTLRLQEIDERFEGRIGVYVHHLARNESLSYQADEPWYLASGVKVPVAIAVLGDIEQGRLSLDTTVRLKDSDFVDGAGQTNSFPSGTPLAIAYLLEQMIIFSDNTAADVLIRTVGLERVNAVAAELLTSGKLVITSLADVRRRTYAMLDPRAESLSSAQLLQLRRIRDPEKRVLALARMLGVERKALLVKDLDAAFDAYYAAGLNSAPLKDYALMLVALADGVALTPPNTAYLLDLMTRVRTGHRRIQASLPAASSFAHKTGTQHRRVCDLGIVTTRVSSNEVKVVLAACAMNVSSQAVSEQALRDVGAAVTASGVLTLHATAPTGGP